MSICLHHQSIMIFTKNARYMQYFACITATMSAAMAGMIITWPSPSMPKLISGDTPLGEPITVEQGSWIVSLIILPPIFLTYHSNWFLEKYGRKYSLLFSTIPVFIGWIIIIFAESVLMLYIARAIAGFGTAFIGSSGPIYIGEIAEKDIRGRLGSLIIFMKGLGYIIVFSVGPFVSFTTLTGICAAMPVLFFLSFMFMPETPYFYMKKGKKEKARKSLLLLSPKNISANTIDKKLIEIEETVNNDMNNKQSWKALLKKEYRMPLLIIFGIKTLQQFSGLVAIDAYMQTILEDSSSVLTPEISSIIYGVVQIPAVLLAAIFVDKLGRKPILLISCVGCALTLIAEGIFFYLKDNLNNDVSSISWLPVTGLILYTISNNIGICTVPYILMGELFTTNIKELACTISMTYSCSLSFIVAKFYEPVSVTLGRYTMFWFFAACCLLGAILSYLFLPETKGKTFDEIQKKLNKK